VDGVSAALSAARIVLFTNQPIANLAEARALHDDDEFVPKAAGATVLATTVLSVMGRQATS